MVISLQKFFSRNYLFGLLIILLLLFQPSLLVRAQTPDPFTSCAAISGIPGAECEVLVALYNSTNGSNWTNHTHWLETNTPEDWYGVIVSNGHVYRVLLMSNNLVGTIPPELGNLTDLRSLDLSGNQLTGTIPASLNNLTQLAYLYLSSNQLSGGIPTGLSNLLELDLSNNLISGSIPPAIQGLSHLKTLYLFYNQLAGSIPPELGNLANLVSLNLSHNQLSGSIPENLGNLSNLTSLYMTNNALGGSIPPQFGNLSNLVWLVLSDNQINGSIPSQLGNLSHLKWLIANDNRLSGSIPPELGQLAALTRLELSYNASLTGDLPASLGNLANLESLLVSSTDLSGSIPDPQFLALTHLSIFHFSGTQICEPNNEAFLDWKASVPTWVSTGLLCAFPNGIQVTGKITDQNGTPVSNVDLAIGGPVLISNIKTLSDGSYSILLPVMGVYTFTPGLAGYQFYPVSLAIQVHRIRSEQNFRARAVNCYSAGVPNGQPCTNQTYSSVFQLPIQLSYADDFALQDEDFSNGLITSWFDHTAGSSVPPATSIELHDGQTYSSLTENLLNGVSCFNRHCSNHLMGTGIKAPAGETDTQIYPAASGVVTEICDPGIRGACERDSRLGRYVLVQHSGTPYATLYGHLAAIPTDLLQGNPVSVSSVIGSMGGSGGRPLREDYWPRQLFFMVFFNGANASPWTPNTAETVDPFGWQPYDERPDDWMMPSALLWKDAHAIRSEAPDTDSSVLSSDGVTLNIPGETLQVGQIITLADSTLGTALDANLRSVWRSFQVKIFDSTNHWSMLNDIASPVSAQIDYSQANLAHLDPEQVTLYQLVDQNWLPMATTRRNGVAAANLLSGGKFALAAPLVCAQDIQEPYDDAPDPYKLAEPWNGTAPLDRTFDTPTDQDWIPVEMMAGITYTFQLTPAGENIDGALSIYAPDGTTLLAAADPAETHSAQIVFTADATGTYFLSASQAAGSVSACDVYQIREENDARFLYIPLVQR
ncbi:peptidase family M23 [Longilinea arvoryzae]|uniref:Peptidase family M23 n=1 Tax=Longilinea arvoryzae TaxID=360412 RepID=A0A0S7BMM4_9CHLR|nr:leucine-rich repeat domain-containing protein [Longilinea arvoryzae]GAP15474.1 peptidase family M23 [Longilinea arvoryzae]